MQYKLSLTESYKYLEILYLLWKCQLVRNFLLTVLITSTLLHIQTTINILEVSSLGYAVVEYSLPRILRQNNFIFLLWNAKDTAYCYIPTSCCFIKLCLTHCLPRQDPDMQNYPKYSSTRRQSQLSFCYCKVYNKVPRMVFNSFRASTKRDKIEWWMRTFYNELYLYHTSKFTIQSCSSSLFLLHMSKNTL